MDSRPVWAHLCSAAAHVLWECWMWKRADFGKSRSPAWLCQALLPACKSPALLFGCKGIFPSAGAQGVSALPERSSEKRKPWAKQSWGIWRSQFVWKWRVCFCGAQFGEQPLSKHFLFASWMHILSWKLLFNDMLAFSCLIYSNSFLPLPCRLFAMKQNYFFFYKPLEAFSLFFVNVLLVRGGKKLPEISKFSWIPVHRFILRAGRHNKRKFVYYNFFPLTFALVQLQHSPSFWHYFLCPLNTFALCFWPSFHWLHPWVDRSWF